MSLQAIISESAHGGLDDSLKALYKQNSDSKDFYLDIAPDEAGKLAFNMQESIRKLETNNGELTKQLKITREKNKPFEELGKSAEEIKTALEASRPEEISKLISDHRGELENLKTSYETALANERTAKDGFRVQVEQTLRDAVVSRLRADHELNETADYVLREFIKVEPKEEGSTEYIERVYENGSPALVAGQPKTPDQLIKGFKEEKKFLSMFNAPNGGGTGGTNRQANINNNKNLEGLSPTEKLKQARAQG